ncbi:hypothetical protein ABC304_06445 [Microbacterium sp. 1P10UB]|uniref:MmyB family transcriptional regulator n=1 Tax=unclassified Microbacterium TaxID=2609290 RepID=UPI0039A1FE85
MAGFRQSVGTDTDDPQFIELVGELSLTSPLFRRLWGRHEIRVRQGASLRFEHPQLGELRVDREKLAVTGNEGMILVIYHAAAGSTDADKLALLASTAAG